MVCAVCERLSWQIVCQTCAKSLLTPEIARRKVGTLEVISLFPYETIELLLTTKHTPKGWRVFGWLGKHIIAPFIHAYAHQIQKPIYIVGVDEQVKGGYSHIACLTHALKGRFVYPLHASLIAQNRVSYSGRSLQYRLQNPRDFRFRSTKTGEAVLVDDVVTTGTTLQEAYTCLQKTGMSVSFAITLCDANRKEP